MPQLIFYRDGEYPQVYDLDDRKTTVGRNAKNALRLKDTHVSAFHAEIIREESGDYRVHDLGSHNGTKIDGKTADKKILKDGDTIRFGLIRARFIDLEPKVSTSKKEQLEEEIEGLRKKAENFTLEKTAKVKLALQESESEKESLSKQIETRKKEGEELTRQIASQTNKIKENNSQLEQKKQNLAKCQTDLDTLIKTIADRERKADQLKSQLEELKKTAADKEETIAALDSKIEGREKRLQEKSDKLGSLEKDYEKLNANLSHTEKQQASLKEKASALTSLISDKTTALRRINNGSIDNGSKVTHCPPLRLIDSKLGSLVHFFHHGAGQPKSERVLPVGIASLAACTKGSIHREGDSLFEGTDPILIVLEGDLEKDKAYTSEIANLLPDRKRLITWPEGRIPHLISTYGIRTVKEHLMNIWGHVDGIISIDPSTNHHLTHDLKVSLPHLNLLLPCPLEESEWNFALPIAQRERDILVSTKGFDPVSPLHRTKLELFKQLTAKPDTTVTLYQKEDIPITIPGLALPTQQVDKVDGSLDYFEYLELIAKHRLVLGFGKNELGGELLDDALLTNTYFTGADSDSFLENTLFGDTAISKQSNNIATSVSNGHSFLENDDSFRQAVDHSRIMGEQHLSFSVGRNRLGEFLETFT